MKKIFSENSVEISPIRFFPVFVEDDVPFEYLWEDGRVYVVARARFLDEDFVRLIYSDITDVSILFFDDLFHDRRKKIDE